MCVRGGGGGGGEVAAGFIVKIWKWIHIYLSGKGKGFMSVWKCLVIQNAHREYSEQTPRMGTHVRG